MPRMSGGTEPTKELAIVVGGDWLPQLIALLEGNMRTMQDTDPTDVEPSCTEIGTMQPADYTTSV